MWGGMCGVGVEGGRVGGGIPPQREREGMMTNLSNSWGPLTVPKKSRFFDISMQNQFSNAKIVVFDIKINFPMKS